MCGYHARLLLLIAVMIQGSVGRDCFFCIYSENSAQVGKECIVDPASYSTSQNTVPCPSNMHCFTESKVLTGTGEVYTYGRGCGVQKAVCEENIHFKTCISICDDHLCNAKTDDVSKMRVLPAVVKLQERKEPTSRNNIEALPTPKGRRVENKGTWCYSCTYSYNPGADDTCVKDPEHLDPVGGYPVLCLEGCFTYRQWSKGESVIRSFSRGCQHTKPNEDSCSEDTHFQSCYYYCNTDYCNREAMVEAPPIESREKQPTSRPRRRDAARRKTARMAGSGGEPTFSNCTYSFFMVLCLTIRVSLKM